MQSVDEKAEQMVLYFAHKSKRDAKYGSIKLAKLMFYADFKAFQYLGNSITGLSYMKLPRGPVPTRAKAIQSSLVQRGLAWERDGKFSRKQLIPVGRFSRKKFLETFSEAELRLMDWVYEKLKGLSGTEVSDLSHEFIGWQVAHWDEVIPYGTTLIDRRPLNAAELEYGRDLAKKLGCG